MGPLERLYLFLHRRRFAGRLRDQVRFEGQRVVSVGNLSAGGTGKTPATMLLARHAVRPLVLLRGYRGSASKEGALVSDGGAGPALDASRVGDEALLFARAGFPVAIGRDRAALIRRFAADRDLVLLDDAFQNPSVFHDHELVLLDARVSPDHMRLFPFGRFREPLSALERASTVLFTHCDRITEQEVRALQTRVETYVRPDAIFRSRHRALGLEPELPEGSAVGVFSGIGRADGFHQAVVALGYRIQAQRQFKDHHFFTQRELGDLFERNPELPWVCTAKDFVRLKAGSYPPERLHVLEIELEILGDREDGFLERVLGPARRR